MLYLEAARVSAGGPKEDAVEIKNMEKEFVHKNSHYRNLLEHSFDPSILTKLEKLRHNNDKA